MAKKVNHVWGLEIGQSALKALRCHMKDGEIVADMFDYVEYPKILSQPEAEPEKLVADALEQFISRNELRDSKIAISVPGQSGLAKFFKPPPVEVKKIPDIVKYEAKQQIPFDLNDVIWDFQQMAGANIEDGYALESEVGLFAMKKEAVFRSLKPFRDANIDVDVIQLAPVSVYNMIAYDRFSDRMANDVFDPEEPPPSSVILSMGTDASDLIVTNGFRIWQRSIPIGGNHFTRQLVKDLKLTFAKAEHLKRNVMQADDPKLVFQAMRPVFNDLVTEIQRSIGFFRSLNKKAEVESIILLGNTAKLPGLQPYLNKNLNLDVKTLEKFDRLSGTEVTGQPAFKENQAGFGVVYGLCLQLLHQGPIHTNLLPQEIVINRLIKAKKPWAIAALSAVLLGIVANFASVYGSFSNVAPELWQQAEAQVTAVGSESTKLEEEDSTKKKKLEFLKGIGEQVASNSERRLLWLEILRAIHDGLRRDPAKLALSPSELPYKNREDFHITKVDSVRMPDLAKWFKPFSSRYAEEVVNREKLVGKAVEAPKPNPNGAAAPAPANAGPALTGPAGAGWVVEISGYHYFNGAELRGLGGADHIRKYLIDYLERGSVVLPGPDDAPTSYTMKELGISYPLLIKAPDTNMKNRVANPEFERLLSTIPGNAVPSSSSSSSSESFGPSSGAGAAPMILKDENGKEVPSTLEAPICHFIVQFAWQEKTLSDRTWWREQKTYDPQKIPPVRAGSAAAAAATAAPTVDPETSYNVD